ncbi:MAG: PASTA domain-containing protein [Salinibacterium sp.]|nr:MAG: PASTA domain-containing protein [Salinibacterium sp.]
MSAQKSPPSSVLTAIAGLFSFSVIAGLLVTALVAPAIAVTGVAASSSIGLFDSLPEYIEVGHQAERNTLYAHSTAPGNVNGYVPIATIYDQNRQEVSYDDISIYAREAAIDGEDRRFFEHGGIDVPSLVRAGLSRGQGGGASTLSMQLVKNIFVQQALEQPTEEARKRAYNEAVAATLDRKLKEMKLAIGLEKKYTKKEILTAYLNIAFFADNTYGIERAAQRYYSVSAKDLTLPQAASLIAIVQFPNSRGLDDPNNFGRNKARRDVILASMLDVGDITQKQYDDAVATPVDESTLKPSESTSGCIGANKYATWFCDFVVKNVKNFEFLGENEKERVANWKQGGYKVYTTLDMDIQVTAQQLVWKYVNNKETALHLGSAAVSVEPGTGRVLTMAVDKVFNDSGTGGGRGTGAVNYATSYQYGGSSGMQSGSTYKLFTLIDWLNHNKGLNARVSGDARVVDQSKFRDSCADGGGWGGPFNVHNDSSGEKGAWSVMNATAASVNGAFVSMALQLDLCDIRHVAESLGVERADGTHLQTNPSSVLGTNDVTPLSMAGAYAAIGAGGKFCPPIVIDNAVSPDGKDLDGQVSDCQQAIDPDVANTAAYALAGVLNNGTGARSNPHDGTPVVGKTGTTDAAIQTWIITTTRKVATAIWVGNTVGRVSLRQYRYNGIQGALLRHEMMRNLLLVIDRKYHGGAFPPPADALLSGSGLAVPDVRGLTPEAAKALLIGLGFDYKDGGSIDSPVEVGRVASTNPSAGSQSGTGAIITVYTSRGNQVPFPNVVGNGTDFTSGQAHAALNSAGFSDITDVCAVISDPTLPSDPRDGKVSASNPPPGKNVKLTVAITLTITQLTCP